MENIPYAKIEKGTFLIATPDHEAGIFFRAVILLCEHNINGSFGLVINKPLHIDLPEELLHGDALEQHHISIRAGGPVQTNQMMLLHNSDKIPNQTMKICEGVFLGGDLPFLQEVVQQEEHDTLDKDEHFPNMFLCFGYSGWGAGQLEREYLDGGWYLHKATANHVFDVPPEALWATLLREMGGKYASLSMIPEDLSVN